jgi:hypothetical protein
VARSTDGIDWQYSFNTSDYHRSLVYGEGTTNKTIAEILGVN